MKGFAPSFGTLMDNFEFVSRESEEKEGSSYMDVFILKLNTQNC